MSGAHALAWSNVCSENGATSPSRWQPSHLDRKMGAISRVYVGMSGAVRAGDETRRIRHPMPGTWLFRHGPTVQYIIQCIGQIVRRYVCRYRVIVNSASVHDFAMRIYNDGSGSRGGMHGICQPVARVFYNRKCKTMQFCTYSNCLSALLSRSE